MDKFVLIDGNSLLNRAFYAIGFFSTKDGQPTNAIYGFVKFLLKIIEDESPRYMAVAFDLPAPTFRHKLYDGYKATRSPMPDELAAQLSPLKNLLGEMNICIAELQGYEADDVIGTLSRAFDDLDVLIYTGDRDSYQLVKENVSVCFTKKGVSVTDRLTNDNFLDLVGLTPAQIIEEKALMGDHSDNIPGVRGIGPKTTMELLKEYHTAEGVFENLEKLSPALQKKLDGQREIAMLSHTLATIDTSVPLAFSREQLSLTFPFPAAAKSAFASLEFRSLMADKYFAPPSSPLPEQRAGSAVKVFVCDSLESPMQAFEKCDRFAFSFEEDGVHLGIADCEYILPLKKNLLGAGFFPEELIPLLKTLFEGEKLALITDYKSLLHKLKEYRVELLCPFEDVSLLSYVVDSNRRAATGKEFAGDFDLPETCSACAIEQTYRKTLSATKGTPEEKIYRELELPLESVLVQMENTGVRVDENRFPELSEKYKKELDGLSSRIFALAGVESFNLNSPFQLSEILFGKLGYHVKGAKKNSKGGYSTNAEVLEKLAEEYEIARLILQYREVQKLQSTYIDGFRPLIRDGIVHTTYHQTMTTTGRLSSSNPNLQNIPVRTERGKELRKLFIARDGNILIDADYSQIELRLLAHFSGCKPLQEAYREGKDIHAITASQVFNVPIDSVTPTMRRSAKAVNFGIIYGISAFGLGRDIGCSTSEAQKYIDTYFKTYTDVKEYMDENVRKAKADGYVTTILGRKRYISELKSSNFSLRAFGERAAMNMPLQGSAADIIKIAMLGVSKRLKEEKLSAQLVLQVHDELILDAPREEEEAAKKILKEEMEGAVSLNVPLIADVSSGESWYDAK